LVGIDEGRVVAKLFQTAVEEDRLDCGIQTSPRRRRDGECVMLGGRSLFLNERDRSLRSGSIRQLARSEFNTVEETSRILVQLRSTTDSESESVGWNKPSEHSCKFQEGGGHFVVGIIRQHEHDIG